MFNITYTPSYATHYTKQTKAQPLKSQAANLYLEKNKDQHFKHSQPASYFQSITQIRFGLKNPVLQYPPPEFNRRTLQLPLPINAESYFNPGIASAGDGQSYHLLYRVHKPLIGNTDWPHVSKLGYALINPDGRLTSPFQDFQEIPFPDDFLREFPHGAEDPRITKIDDTYYIVFNASHRNDINPDLFRNRNPQHLTTIAETDGSDGDSVPSHELTPEARQAILDNQLAQRGATIYLVTTKDFKHFTYVGDIGPKQHGESVYDKNAFFHPEMVDDDGKESLLLYHRIYPDIIYTLVPKNELEEFKSETFWKNELSPEAIAEHTLLKPKFAWETESLGAGSPPLRTDNGWLFIYHASAKQASSNKNTYSVGAALLDLDDPTHVIARSPEPILRPNNILLDDGKLIIPSGSIIHNGKLYIYYGADDKRCRTASCDLDALLKYLTPFDENGELKSTVHNQAEKRGLVTV